MNGVRFRDRSEAGRRLASALKHYAGRSDLLLLGLPRGGVPVAYEVARALHAPLDVMLVRKLGVPGHEEFAMGAIASGGIRVITRDVVTALGIPEATLEIIISQEEQELRRREQAYRGDRPPPQVQGKTVILVDDGLATGSTMRAAEAALKAQHPAL
jgi:predicted phosphoribosyltransferase